MNTVNIEIQSLNESFVFLNTEKHIIRELSEHFTFFVDGYKFMPAYKMGTWDGTIKLLDVNKRVLPKGLVPKLLNVCKNHLGYRISFESGFIDPFKEPITIPSHLNLPVEPREFQLDAVNKCLKKKRQIILSATGSGKSLIIYMLIRSILESSNKKILIVVPTVGLVNQMYGDFAEYSQDDSMFDTDNMCHKVFSGEIKESNKPITISTWQSLYKLPQKYFEQYDCVIGDEVHTFQAKACTSIMDKSINAFYRFGFTGTIQDAKSNEIQLIANFGPVYRVSSTKKLMDQNILASLEIKALLLQHKNVPTFRRPGACTYAEEVDWIVTNKTRNKFICNLAEKTEGNTLILFQFVEKHGKVLNENLEKQLSGKKTVHYVHGGTNVDQRESVRKFAENDHNTVILASFGVFSTGINIKNIQNIIFASPSKSKIRVLQSIGRGLRKSKENEICKLFDIADDTRDGRKKENYTLKHARDRYNLYNKEGFVFKLIEVPLDNVY